LIDPWIQETSVHCPQYAPTIDELEVAVYSMFTEFDMKLSPDQELVFNPSVDAIARSFLYRVTLAMLSYLTPLLTSTLFC
jgi:hypothetical protein